jgi:hypothetical protein
MTYNRLAGIVAAGLFLIGLVLVVIGGHVQGVEECLFGGLTAFAVAHI